MENVTKALLIAAGILFAIILLSLLISMHNRLSGIAETKEEILEQEQLEEFNRQYEYYNKDMMYGVDVITLINKINQNNTDHPYQPITMYLNESEEIRSINLYDDNTATITTSTYNYNVVDFPKRRFASRMIYDDSGRVRWVLIYSLRYEGD